MSGMSALQSTVHSLPIKDLAPSFAAMAAISAFGPASKEVPESTMALVQLDMELFPS